MKRIQVVGGPGSGKSSLAREIAAVHGLTHFEMDELFWKDNWERANRDEFRARLSKLLDAEKQGWVIAGGYTDIVGDIMQERIDTYVFLYIPRWKTIPRVVRRSIKHAVNKQPIVGNNKESLKGVLGMIRFAIIKPHKSRKARAEALQQKKTPFEVLIFGSNTEARKHLLG